MLGLDGHGDDRLGIVSDLLERFHLRVRRDGRTGNGVLQASDGDDIARFHTIDRDAVRSDRQGDRLGTLHIGHARHPQLHPAADGPGEQPADGDLAGMGVDDDLGDHHGDRARGIAGQHGLADLALLVALPDDGDTALLRFDGVGNVLDDHAEKDLVDGGLLGQGPHIVVPAVLVDVLERDAGLLHAGNVNGPVVVGGAESDRAVLGTDLPLLVKGLGKLGDDALVDLGDNGHEALLHLLLGDLQLVDQAVDLVDEQHRADALLQGLPDDRLGLRHYALYSANYDDTAVEGPHGPGDVPAEVHVTRRVDEVDEVFLTLVGVHHRGVGGIDGDAAGLLLLVEVEHQLLSREVTGHHAGAGDKIVTQSGLTVVDVRRGTDVANEFRALGERGCLRNVIFLASHKNHL